jgi:hypothetical protein
VRAAVGLTAIVLLGGADARPHRDVWPSARSCHSTVFDIRTGVLLVYGGASDFCGKSIVADSSLWSWGGSAWQRVSAVLPGLREDALMAIDTRRNVLVLYGGRNGASVHRDTWEWDGNTWTRRSESAGPGPVEHSAMAYDEARGRVVLFGGGTRTGEFRNTTWEWDGEAWQQRAAGGPAARVGHSMAFAAGAVMLYGGFNDSSSLRDLWRWDGNAWTRISASGPTFTEGLALAATTDGLLVTGTGLGQNSVGAPLRIWRLRDGSWQQVADNGPPNRVGQAISFDARRNALIVTGGAGGSDAQGRLSVWEWGGEGWRQR